MQIRPLASSSAGNCYHVTDGQTQLLIECGLPIRRIREALDFRLSEVQACLVSHEHGDHSKAACDLFRLGIPLGMSRGTAACLFGRDESEWPFAHYDLEDQVQVQIGTWTVLPFRVMHDAAEPLGFLLASGAEKLLFLTDSAYSPFRFQGLTHIMIECNYTRAALDGAIDDGRTHPGQRPRLLASHMSLEQVLEMLAKNDLSRLQGIWLLHLSDANSDELEMKRAVQRATGVPVYVCER